MRPVEKGKRNEIFKPYKTAQDPLADAIGRFCSYCEMRVNNSIEVEHIVSKSKGGEEHSWENFLLACRPCNGSGNKGAVVNSRNGYFWPDKDNTFLAFLYDEINVVLPNPSLSKPQQKIAADTIALLGIDRTPYSRNPCTKADKRYLTRESVWGMAKESLSNWKKNPSPEMRDQIVISALGHGFFSVWMTVFKNEAAIKLALINAFPGTAKNCFDKNANPVPRPGGNL